MSMRPRILCSLLLFALLAPVVALAQSTLGGITGLVTDSAGATLPGTSVTVTNSQTGLTRTQPVAANGFYLFSDLPIGTYTLVFTKDGFKSAKFPGLLVQADRTLTVPAQLAVGAVTESVTAEITPLMNAVDTTNGYVLEKEQIESIPLPTGSFTGLATQSPGVNAELSGGTGVNSGLGNAPIWANGQRDTSNSFLLNGVDASNLFNGKSTSQSGGARVVNNTGVGNTGAGGVEQSEVSIYLAIGNALPTPAPETIQEVRVNASMYDASQGSTSGAHIDLSTASGGNTFHGQTYFHRGSNWLNAAPFFFKNDQDVPANLKTPELHRYILGGTLGGPIIKDKLFAYLAYQHVHISDAEVGDSFLTVPSGLDNTTTTRTAAGLDNLAGLSAGTAVNPVALFLFNAKVNNQYIVPGATPGVTPTTIHPDNAFIPGRAYFYSDQVVANLDYNATPKDTIALKYYWQHDPTLAPFGFSNVSGFPVHVDVGTHVFSIQNTYLVRSNLSTTQTLGFDRMKAYETQSSPFSSQQAGINTSSLLAGEFGSTFPGISILNIATVSGVNQSLSFGEGSFSQGTNTGTFQNRIMPSTNGLWTIGKHNVGFGASYAYTQLNIRDRRTGNGMVSSPDFADFVQGNLAYQNDSFTTTTFLVGNANRYYRANQVGSYLQDKFQIKSNLSITAGVRYDWNGGLTEKNGNIFNFDPAAYDAGFNKSCLTNGQTNPASCYATSGLIIASNNPQATPGASKTTLTGRQWGFGPRVGVAWQPEWFHNKVVVRAGSGIYYDRGENFSFFSAGYAIGEVTGGPFGVAQSPPFVNAVQCDPEGFLPSPPGVTCGGTYSLSTPYGSATTYKQPTGKASDFINYLQTPAAIADGAPMTTFTDYAKDNKLPYTMNYTLDIQWQPVNNLLIEVGYVGNLARHQVVPLPLNQAQIATPGAPVNGEIYSYGYSPQQAGSSYCYYACNPTHLPNGNLYLTTGEGGNIDLRVPHVGYASESETYKAAGVADYNALQVHVERRLAHGLAVGASYTWSHALDEQSDIGLFYTGNNALNLRSGYGNADFDRTHVLNANFTYNIYSPFKDTTLAGKFTAGWSISSLITVQSGQPYSVIDFSGAVGSVYYSTYDGITNPVVPLAPGFTPKSAKTGNSGAFEGKPALFANAFTLPLLTPAGSKVSAATTAQYGTPGPSSDLPNGDIFETTFTSGQRNIFRQSAQKRADLAIAKNVALTEHLKLRYDFKVFNLFNTASFDIPAAEVTQNSAYNPTPTAADTIATFFSAPSNVGYVSHTIGSPRQTQMALHLVF